jgi:hypothetical protein
MCRGSISNTPRNSGFASSFWESRGSPSTGSSSASTLAWCAARRRSPPLRAFSTALSPRAILSAALMLEGRGAGAGPTASAVVADLVDIATGRLVPPFGVPTSALDWQPGAPMERHQGAYYIRLMVVDQPGVIADVAAALRDRGGLARVDDPARPLGKRGGASGADDPCYGGGGDAAAHSPRSASFRVCWNRRT